MVADKNKNNTTENKEENKTGKITNWKEKITDLIEFLTYGIWRIDYKSLSKKTSVFYNIIKTIILTVRNTLELELGVKAASLTYRTVLAIVPFLAVLFAIARGFGFENIIQSEILDYLGMTPIGNVPQGESNLTIEIITLINNSLEYARGKVWALFGEKALPYDLDRNPDEVPSLAEMTEKALEILSKQENGFFLMVEGSQVDWAAHANDPVGIVTEFLAFDEAVGKVMDFARSNGETAVVVLADHGNGGFTIGSSRCKGYDKLSLAELFSTVSQCKLTASGIEAVLVNTPREKLKDEFKKYTGIDLTDEEVEILLSSKNYKAGDYTQVKNSNIYNFCIA